ncbi:MAG: hypothetical protein V4596_02495 [Bdellovibrionota bacterium]
MFLILVSIFLSIGSYAKDVAYLLDCPIADSPVRKLTSQELISNINDYLVQKEVSPFPYACQKKGDLKNMSATGIGHRNIPSQDSQGNLSRDFFLILLTKIENYIKDNINLTSNIEGCLGNSKSHAECKEILNWAKKVVPLKVQEARYHLSLGTERDAATATQLYFPNTRLDTLRSFKETPWQRLTPKEIQSANAALKEYMDKGRAITHREMKGENVVERVAFLDSRIRDIRFEHMTAYRALIGEMPLMNYITSANPSFTEIKNAARKTHDNALKELAKIQKLKAELKANPRVLYNDLFYAVNYSNLYEETLLENPRFCPLGAAIFRTNDNRVLGNAIAIGAPLLVASFLAPPAAAVVGGLVAGAAFAAQSQHQYSQTKQRNLGKVFSENGEVENEELRQDKKYRNLDLVMFPLSGLGAGAISKYGRPSILSKFKSKNYFPKNN